MIGRRRAGGRAGNGDLREQGFLLPYGLILAPASGINSRGAIALTIAAVGAL